MAVRKKPVTGGDIDEERVEPTSQATGLMTVPARIRLMPADPVLTGAEQSGEDGNRYTFNAEISNTSTDAYFTHMAPTTLRNFAQAASRGVALLDSHSGRKLGVGYSTGGRYEEESNYGRTVVGFYITPGIRFGGQHSYASTDDFIKAIESGTVRDVSVGFYGGRWVCDICRQPYLDYDACNHLAGWEYDVEIDGRMERVTCTVTIHEAELSEVSLVYDGATPGAMILKAEQGAEAGRLSPELVRQIERRYRVKLPGQTVSERTLDAGSAAGVADANGEGAMGDSREQEEVVVQEVENEAEATTEATNAMTAEVRQALSETAAPADLSVAEGVRWLSAQLAQATSERDQARQEVAQLQPLAEVGREYRQDLISQAVAEGVRALGEAFPEETYRAMLEAAPLEHIRQVRDTFARQAAERFPGGRQTRDMNEEKEEAEERVPAAAYGVRA